MHDCWAFAVLLMSDVPTIAAAINIFFTIHLSVKFTKNLISLQNFLFVNLEWRALSDCIAPRAASASRIRMLTVYVGMGTGEL